nr:CoA transferase [Salinicola acroporae]
MSPTHDSHTAQDRWQEQLFSGETSAALAGVKVLDLSRLVAGNMTSMQLGDFGADVVKVEPTPAGDPLRAWQSEGVSSFWKVYGRNKRSLALDFRREGAVALLRELIASADVLIENFRPGTLEKMGLAPETLLAATPRSSCFACRASVSPALIVRAPGSAPWSKACPALRTATVKRGADRCSHRWRWPT